MHIHTLGVPREKAGSMTKTYTLTEVATALEADPKTLREWIKREGWDISNQTSKYDKRVNWLTEEQVSTLAKAHERLWPPRPKSAAQAEAQATGLTGAVGILRQHVEELRADHVSVAQWKQTVIDLYKRLESAESKYGELLVKHGDLLLRVGELEKLQARKPGRATRAGDQGDDQGEAVELEPGLVSAAAFAQAHGVNPATAKSAWQSGRVPTIRGEWRVAGVRGNILIALPARIAPTAQPRATTSQPPRSRLLREQGARSSFPWENTGQAARGTARV